MREMQRIKRLIVPLLKGSPIIIGCFLIALFIARKAIQYSVPQYQSMAKIKLDDRKYGMSANNLYEDFDVFSSENKIETEAEILKSPLLIGETVDLMGLDVLVKRVGALKTTTLYKDNPFIFTTKSGETNYTDQPYILNVKNDFFEVRKNETEVLAIGRLGEYFLLEGDSLKIDLNQEVLSQKQLAINGKYEFNVKSRDKWISHINEMLNIKAIDKEIPVLRVVVKSEDPYFSADFANNLCDVYVNDYIHTKSISAAKTLNFIDDQMEELKMELSQSENRLEGYKIANDVVNTRQETETGLREISKLKLQLINLEMEAEAITELDEYISNGDYYEETAMSVGFGDLLLTELVKKLKLYTDDKRDLLVKYTEKDERVVNIQEKIDDVEAYIKEAISSNRRNIETQRKELERSIMILSSQFDDIPTREKEVRILERDFHINEAVYTFLAEKKLEAQIAASAFMSFHRVIQPATVNKEPVSPNRVLITFVCGFLGLFGGIIIVFGGKFISGKILTKTDIEKLTATPVIYALTNCNDALEKNNAFAALVGSIGLSSDEGVKSIAITSSIKDEGKSFIAQNLAETYAQIGYSVAIIDCNRFNPSFNQEYDYTLATLLKSESKAISKPQANTICKIGIGGTTEQAALTLVHKELPKVINQIKSSFDFVIMDTPGSVISMDAIHLLKQADVSLYIIRVKQSRAQYLPNVDIIAEDYNLNNIKIVLNGAHRTSNYSGNFKGARLNYFKLPKGIFRKLNRYIRFYS